jgi:hypothetical protein
MNRTAAHTRLKRSILASLGARKDLRIFDNPRGFDRLIKVSYGLAPGASDLLGIAITGKFLALEVKTGDAVATKEQEKFLAMIKAFNGVGRVVRSVEEAEAAADEAAR